MVVEFSLVVAVVAVFMGCSWYYGHSAFRHGLAVKRWAFVGLLFGPLVYPMFSTHKHLAYRKTQGLNPYKVNC